MAKQHRKFFKKLKHRKLPSKIFQQVDSDLKGPIKDPTGLNGEVYIISFICIYSRYKLIYCINKKSDSIKALQSFIAEVLTPIRNSIGLSAPSVLMNILHTDGGHEYLGEFIKVLESTNFVRHTTTAPRTPEHNSFCEEYWRILMGTARAMLYQSRLKYNLWPYAVGYSNYILNRTLLTVRDGIVKTPYEWVYNEKPDLSGTKTWGCEVHTLVDAQFRKDLDPHNCKGYFMGFDKASNQPLIYAPQITYNRGIFVSRDVVFQEVISPRVDINTGNVLNTKHKLMQIDVTNNDFKVIPSQEELRLVQPLEKPFILPDHIDPSKRSKGRYKQNKPPQMIIKTPKHTRSKKLARKSANNMLLELVKQVAPDDKKLHEQVSKIRLDTFEGTNLDNYGSSVHTSSGREVKKRHLNSDEYAYKAKADIMITLEEALFSERRKEWIDSIIKELNSHRVNRSWELAIIPEGKRPLGTKLVLRRKFDEHGNETKLKARLVIQGFKEVYGVDYSETFAPVSKLTSIRTFLAIANQFQMHINQMDVETAFLHADLNDEIYIEPPWGIDIEAEINSLPIDDPIRIAYMKDPATVGLQVKKAIYGLKQAPKEWYDRINKFLQDNGYVNNPADPCIYHKSVKGKFKSMIALYVDDLLIASTSESEVKKMKDALRKEYPMEDKGEPTFMLGIQISRDKEAGTIAINQTQFINDLVKNHLTSHHYRQSTRFPATTPVCPHHKLSKELSPSTEEEKREALYYASEYRSIVGALMYLMLGTRPDIAYAVSNLSKFVSNPGKAHMKSAWHLLWYLDNTKDQQITYTRSNTIPLQLICYSDSEWAGCHDTRRSQSGGLIFLAGGPVSWASSQQGYCSLSSAEAELGALVLNIKEVLWLRKLLYNLDLPQGPTVIYGDNTASMIIAQRDNQVNKRTKHIDLFYHFASDEVNTFKSVELKYINTNDNIADICTKGTLSKATFDYLFNKLYDTDIKV